MKLNKNIIKQIIKDEIKEVVTISLNTKQSVKISEKTINKE